MQIEVIHLVHENKPVGGEDGAEEGAGPLAELLRLFYQKRAEGAGPDLHDLRPHSFDTHLQFQVLQTHCERDGGDACPHRASAVVEGGMPDDKQTEPCQTQEEKAERGDQDHRATPVYRRPLSEEVTLELS